MKGFDSEFPENVDIETVASTYASWRERPILWFEDEKPKYMFTSHIWAHYQHPDELDIEPSYPLAISQFYQPTMFYRNEINQTT